MTAPRAEFVVYTVLTGLKEDLATPFPPNSVGFERICFTDDSLQPSSAGSLPINPNCGESQRRGAGRFASET